MGTIQFNSVGVGLRNPIRGFNNTKYRAEIQKKDELITLEITQSDKSLFLHRTIRTNIGEKVYMVFELEESRRPITMENILKSVNKITESAYEKMEII